MDLERTHVVPMNGCKFSSPPIRFRNSVDRFLIHYSMMNSFSKVWILHTTRICCTLFIPCQWIECYNDVLQMRFEEPASKIDISGKNKNYKTLSYDVASESEITPCNKICKPLVVYRFTGNVITSITTLRTWWQNHNVFTPEMRFQRICHMINRI